MWREINLQSWVKCGFYWAYFHGIHNHRVNSCGQLLQRVLARSCKNCVKYGGKNPFFAVNYDCRWADCHRPTFTGQIFVKDSYTELQEYWKTAGTKSEADKRTWSPHSVFFLYEYIRPETHATQPGCPLESTSSEHYQHMEATCPAPRNTP